MPGAGVGVAAGPSGLVILDVDNHGAEPPENDAYLPGVDLDDVQPGAFVNGWDTIAALAEVRSAPLPWLDPPTLTVMTPSGGLHAWFRVEHPERWRQSASKLGWQVDIKAGWGYGIAPGTTTEKGEYRAVGDVRTIADMPAWLAADLKRTGHYVEPDPVRQRMTAKRLLSAMRPMNSRYVEKAVRAEVEQLAATAEGGRNAATYAAARALGRFIPAGQLSEAEVEDLVVNAACTAGLSEREARTAARSGIKAGRARGAVA